MPLDGLTVFALGLELHERLVNAKIDKVSQPIRDELVLQIRKNSQNHKLLINLNTPRVHFIKENRENPQKPPMFCMLMRKHLIGALIKSVNTFNYERLLEIELDTYDELGFKTTKYLVIELLGKFSNVILLNSERIIIDSIRRVDFEMSIRAVLPNIYYDRPPSQNKIDILELTGLPLCTGTFLESVSGTSPLLCEILYDENPEILRKNIENLKKDVKSKQFSCYLLEKNGKPFDFTIVHTDKYTCTKQENFSDLLCDFYENKDKANALNSAYKELSKTLKNLIKRKTKKIEIQTAELDDTKTREIYKQYGDIIVSNMYNITDVKQESITLINYFDENMSEIEIPLDIKLTAKQNADKYFAKYTKLKTAEEILHKEIEKAHNDVFYLESILEALERTTSTIEIAEIKSELMLCGFIKSTKTNKKQAKSTPNKYVSVDGFTIYSGKNNIQNDELTLKLASKNDIWLHTQKIHGTHVIIVTDGQEVPETTLIEASRIAVLNSKAKNSTNVPVDYCLVKDVKKPRGAKAGMVIYNNFKTIFASAKE